MITLCAKHPKTDQNQVPLYSVTWNSVNKRGRTVRTGDSYTASDAAKRVYDAKLAASLDPQIELCHVGGFV